MRNEIAEKIEYFYKDQLSIINECLRELFSLDFFIGMVGTEIDIKNGSKDESGAIKLDESIGFNSTLVFSEIFEDLQCSFDLLKLGYFKNSRQVLRNTQELLLQLLLNNILIKRNEQEKSKWLTRKRGIENIYDTIKILKREVPSDQKLKITEVGKFYNLLNASTHSHKSQLNITKTGRFRYIVIWIRIYGGSQLFNDFSILLKKYHLFYY
ncbi:MAG TPA: hypothetical protein PK110_12695 [Niabella sp.]|mgnify:CR=1 FL=1|nr:hypothetical protein [Niabella sp.]